MAATAAQNNQASLFSPARKGEKKMAAMLTTKLVN